MRQLLIRFQVALMPLCFFLLLFGNAFAQEEEEASSAAGFTTWLAPYGIIFLCVGLGMLVVLKSSRRRNREKPEQYEG